MSFSDSGHSTDSQVSSEDENILRDQSEAADESGELDEEAIDVDPLEGPKLLKSIEEGTSLDIDEDIGRIEVILTNHPEAQQDILAAIVALVQRGISSSTPEDARTRVVNLYCTIFVGADPPRAHLLEALDPVVLQLRSGDVINRQSVLGALETLASAEDEQHCPRIIEALRTHLFEEGLELSSLDTISVLESFDNMLIYSRGLLIKCAVHAGAVECVLKSFVRDDLSINKAAIECLTSMVSQADEINPALTGAPEVGKWNPVPPVNVLASKVFIQGLQSDVPSVAAAGADFFNTSQQNQDEDVRLLFANSPDALRGLVRLLGKKDIPRQIGSACEWGLMALYEPEETKQAVVTAMREFWEGVGVSVGEKLAVADGMCSTFLDLRFCALSVGMATFLANEAASSNPRALEVLADMMKDEQTMGEYLLKADGTIQRFGALLESQSSDVRCGAAQVLECLCDAYTEGDERLPLRVAVVDILLSDDIIPRILAAIAHDDPKTAGAASHLLGEILLEEAGTESWSWDRSNPLPPACPNKERLGTPQFLRRILSLLDNAQSTQGAVYLISQFVWGYPSTFNIVRDAMREVVPAANVHFFARLYQPDDLCYNGRQQPIVAEAAAQAGALERVTQLLEATGLDHTKEERRAAVEGYRFVSYAKSVDENFAMKIARLPLALTELVADEDIVSLELVESVLRWLGREDEGPRVHTWSSFGSSTTAQHLANFVDSHPYGCSEPIAETGGEVSSEIWETWRAKDEEAKALCDKSLNIVLSIINRTLPSFAKHLEPILKSLVLLSLDISPPHDLIETARKIVDAGADTSALVIAFCGYFSRATPSQPISLSIMLLWSENSPLLSLAIVKAGGVDVLLNILRIESGEGDEDEVDLWRQSEALVLLGSLARYTPEDGDAIHTRFFADSIALPRAVEALKSEYQWEKTIVALSDFCINCPSASAALLDAGVDESTLLEYFDKEDGQQVAVLLSHLAPLEGNGALSEHLKAHFERLKNGNVGGKGKKKRKKVFGLSSESLWERVNIMAGSCPAGRASAVHAGAIPEAIVELQQSNTVLEFFIALLKSDEGYDEKLLNVIPLSVDALQRGECVESHVQIIRAFPPEVLVSTGSISLLAGFLVTEDAGTWRPGQFELVLSLVVDAAETTDGEEAVADGMRGVFTELGSEDYDSERHGVHGITNLAVAGPGVGRAALKAGATEYALRLLQSGDTNAALKGASAAALLSVCPHTDVCETLVSLDAISLVHSAILEVQALSEKSYKPVAGKGKRFTDDATTHEVGDEVAEDASSDFEAFEFEHEMFVGAVAKLGVVLRVLEGKEITFQE